jgi:hypothetical protein
MKILYGSRPEMMTCENWTLCHNILIIIAKRILGLKRTISGSRRDLNFIINDIPHCGPCIRNFDENFSC